LPCWPSACCAASCKSAAAPAQALKAGVCETCFGTGYKGRLAVYEIMTMTDELRVLTANRADAVTLYDKAKEKGFKPMRVDALEKVRLGMTDEAEVYRVLH
jgi:type IV pilus assembly protein PilB